ncbi:Fe(3+)-hydroxamate ABC transporter permease FhuB [Neisseriaceae bacterium ESL0693]|nr:Fe(3+)-hydroxamate ABC transporter permease FhuB [Neisseriaceae bacterium ESL0693]
MVKQWHHSRLGFGLIMLGFLCLISSGMILQQQYQPLNSDNGDQAMAHFMLLYGILPRMTMAFLVGGSLGLASLLLQQILRNPIASDSTLGVTAGAQTALMTATVFAPSLLTWSKMGVTFAGACVAMMMVLWLSRHKQFDLLMVVLAGMVLSLYCGAVSGVLLLFNSEELTGSLLWSAGTLIQDSWHDPRWLCAGLLLAVLALVPLLRPLNMLSLGDEQAIALGLPVRWIRLATLLLAAWLSALVVSLAGMMGFIGLAAAALTSQLGARTLKSRCMVVFLLGALLLWLTDNLITLIDIYTHLTIPTGAVTALIGAPLLLWLMFRTRQQSGGIVHATIQPLRLPERQTMIWISVFTLLMLLISLGVSKGQAGWLISYQYDLLNLRWPRLMAAAAAGVLLANAGVLLQRLTHNPMASPELLGISASVGLGVLLAVLLLNVVVGSVLFWLVGIGAALLSLFFIMLLNYRSQMSPNKIMLTGIALAALTDAFIRVWNSSGDFRVLQMLTWLSGSTYHVQPPLALLLAILAGLMLIISCLGSRWLALLGLEATVAQSVGVPVMLARVCLVTLAAVMTAIATIAIGPLSFVGLLAPHMARMLGARLPRQQLILSAMIGVILMMLADWLGRQLLFPYEIPTGLMATLLGGIYFLILMRRL